MCLRMPRKLFEQSKDQLLRLLNRVKEGEQHFLLIGSDFSETIFGDAAAAGGAAAVTSVCR